MKAKEEETSKEFFRKVSLAKGSSSLARMALALGNRQLGSGHLAAWLLAAWLLAAGTLHGQLGKKLAHNSGLDESS